MASTLPEILGEYIDAPLRYEVNGLQYTVQTDPPKITPGEEANLCFYFQNMMNAPLAVEVKVRPPTVGRFRMHPVLQFEKDIYTQTLQEAEVGIFTIPFAVASVTPGSHTIELEIKTAHDKDAKRIRAPKKQDPMSALPLKRRAGLGLVPIIGCSYNVQSGKKIKVPVSIKNAPAAETPSDVLKASYSKLWDRDLGYLQLQAQQEINKNRAIILNDLNNVEALFAALYAETQQRFADVGLPLRIGEAIALGKLLVYVCHMFLKDGKLQDGLLVPIWERAIFNNYDTSDIRQTFRDIGYKHILRLTLAISFEMLARAAGNDLPWSRQECDGVTEYIVDALEDGLPMEEDFLYIPLVMAGTLLLKQVRLPGEDVAQTIQLVKQAHDARTQLFTDDDTQIAEPLFAKFLGMLQK